MGDMVINMTYLRFVIIDAVFTPYIYPICLKVLAKTLYNVHTGEKSSIQSPRLNDTHLLIREHNAISFVQYARTFGHFGQWALVAIRIVLMYTSFLMLFVWYRVGVHYRDSC